MKPEGQPGTVLRRFAPGEEQQLGRLAKLVWGLEAGPAYWRWKYFENPFGDHFSYAAWAGDQMVGFIGAMSWPLTILAQDRIGAQVTDMMLHPDWRTKGVFFPLNSKTRDEIAARAEFHFGVATPVSGKIYSKRYGYGEGHHPEKMQRIIRLGPLVWQQLRSGRLLDTDTINRLLVRMLRVSRSHGPPPSSVTIRHIEAFDERFDALWRRIRGTFKVCTTRSRQYLNWRYAANPLHSYRILAAEDQGDLLGFAVLRCRVEQGVSRGCLVDFLFDAGREDVMHSLVAESLSYFRSQKAAMAVAWVSPASPMTDYLAASGFSRTAIEQIVFLCGSLSPEVPHDVVYEIGNWHLTMGDAESL